MNTNDDLTNFECPRLNCEGRLNRANSHWECSECSTLVQNREHLWQLIDKFQKESCISALNGSLKAIK
jgi:hypothetical protein